MCLERKPPPHHTLNFGPEFAWWIAEMKTGAKQEYCGTAVVHRLYLVGS